MNIHILTIFPEMFQGPMSSSIIGRACQKGLLSIEPHNLRDYTKDKHRQVDDTPYGGGAGMVMKAEPFFEALTELTGSPKQKKVGRKIIMLTPQGATFTQKKAQELATMSEIIFLCGRYEGIDERVRQTWVDEEISIGDYILTGGELATMVIIDALVRFLPGALGDEMSAQEESFSDGLLEYPQYTKPATWQGMTVPAPLLSGHHEQIRKWRRKEAFKRTYQFRPELLRGRSLSIEDQILFAEALQELGMPVEIEKSSRKKKRKGRTKDDMGE
ncbi:tRNA (guanosine(37)-N1)-methyltransferase TrmD [Heliorestis acidaminivorans]|uniref:tRNA (guanine-N(1)-)-methyltransferase n=1 Tax=Heliorestis acidaminivorans TaxID=553427 RepID=A0A6I0EXD1_9FIRM|nr:tRNA (guanosine(37)-N1)-methyltransferase TrmD [Heliorestis acidaminivorans]KAB2954429.1 tRNA (guanosine(37)-N1)-methyltransferase TrmD [Heliorestis acidaminivorans]